MNPLQTLFFLGLFSPIIAYCQTANLGKDSLQNYLSVAEPKDSLQVDYRLFLSNIFLGENKLDSAQYYVEEAIHWAELIPYSKRIWEAKQMKAHIHLARSEYVEAVSILRSAIENHKDNQEHSSDGGAHVYNSLGVVYLGLEDNAKAAEAFERAIAIEDSMGISSVTPMALVNLGRVEFALGREGAIDKIKRAKALGKDFMYVDYMSKIDANLAEIYLESNELDSAIFYINEAMADSADPRIANTRTYVDAVKAKWYLKAEGYQSALNIAESLIQIGEAHGLVDYALEGSQIAYEASAALDDPAQALRFLEQAMQWKDSLQGEEVKRSFDRRELEVQFEHEQVLQTMAFEQSLELEKERSQNQLVMGGAGAGLLLLLGGFLLYRQETRKKKKERELKFAKTEAEMKALRAQMDPHFIRNSLVKLDSKISQGKTEEARSFVMRFSNLLDRVLTNSQVGEVSLEDDLAALRLYMDLEMEKHDHSFDYSIHVAKDVDPHATLIPSLLLQPFVENSIIHGFTDEAQGHIKIAIHKGREQLIISIEDNGIGRIAATETKEISPASQRSHGFGTSIAESRLKLLDSIHHSRSSIRFEDLTRGTRVLIALPFLLDE